MPTAVENMLASNRTVRLMGLGLKFEGVIKHEDEYALAASAAVLMTFTVRDARCVSLLTEQLYGSVTRESAAAVTAALARLDQRLYLPPDDSTALVRLYCNYGTRHDVGGRTWATNVILETGVRPHALVPHHAAVPLNVDCVVGEIPDRRYPYIVADVPRSYAPALAVVQHGQWCSVPRIPKSFIVGVNGLPLSSFEATWNEYHGQ